MWSTEHWTSSLQNIPPTNEWTDWKDQPNPWAVFTVLFFLYTGWLAITPSTCRTFIQKFHRMRKGRQVFAKGNERKIWGRIKKIGSNLDFNLPCVILNMQPKPLLETENITWISNRFHRRYVKTDGTPSKYSGALRLTIENCKRECISLHTLFCNVKAAALAAMPFSV